MIGLGRTGTNMARRLLRSGHDCVVYDLQPEAVQALGKEGAVGTTSLADFANKLKKRRPTRARRTQVARSSSPSLDAAPATRRRPPAPQPHPSPAS